MTVLPERHLFGPGPGNPYPEATAALAAPLLGHLDPDFLDIMDSACDGLRTVFGTANRRTLPLSATGSAGMEAAFVNLVHPGDVVVVGVNGLFGQRMCDVAARCGAEVIAVEHEWGQPLSADRIADAHPRPALIAAVHAETSTGVRSDLAALGAVKGDALLVADTVTSIAGLELRLDDWGVDVAYAGTQKCLGVPPGLAPFTINDAAFERRRTPSPSWYLDLGMLGGYVGETSDTKQRTYHHTAPTAMVASLAAALRQIVAEGLENVLARHAEAGQLLQDGLVELGLELFAAEGHRLPDLTTVKVPAGVDSARVRSYLLDRHRIEIGAGAGPYASTVWRLGLMGHNARPDRALFLLAAMKDALAHAGRP
ncbi:pyridoxal-phosphate-dependent aminotransferase family protein [Microlunatus sp. Y2014]|uniref:pyridoxal-phosphate-dependent aminotransferase family protein n=1 Tax=Microlunatus sp. Y2014 TaxID=3418488 RepID=UPI003DA6CF06